MRKNRVHTINASTIRATVSLGDQTFSQCLQLQKLKAISYKNDVGPIYLQFPLIIATLIPT